jgi:hypothetical protein
MKVIQTNGILVKIYSNKTAMRRALRSIGYKCDHTESMVVPCESFDCKGGDCKKTQVIGELYSHKKVSMPVLAHEIIHAATTVIRAQKRSLNLGPAIKRPEERLAYTHTAIMQDVLHHFFPLKNSSYKWGNLNTWINGSIKENSK